jgi:flagellin
MTVINTNTAATIAANALTKNERAMSTAMERLSTGQRINSASDDAAGLAISSKMTSQVNGLNQAVRNANDAISMIQTEDGAMVEVTNMLQRMRTLAVQAASGTNTSTDRTALDLEFTALAAQIQDIGSNTQWNGTSMLDGSTTTATTFQVGANANQEVTHTFSQIKTTAISNAVAVLSGAANGEGATNTTTNNADVDTIGFSGATFATGDTLNILIDGIAFSAEVMSVNASNIVNGLRFHGSSTTISHDGTNATNSHVFATTELLDTNSSGAITAEFTAEGTLTLTGATSGAGNYHTTTEPGDTANNTGATIAKGATVRGLIGGIQYADISTAQGAGSALKTVDHAIEKINNARATSGSVISRLEYTADNLANVSQNTSASRSRVLDADYATETTELARTQIIQQAGTAMLSQANQQAQSILALLK